MDKNNEHDRTAIAHWMVTPQTGAELDYTSPATPQRLTPK